MYHLCLILIICTTACSSELYQLHLEKSFSLSGQGKMVTSEVGPRRTGTSRSYPLQTHPMYLGIRSRPVIE